jgi:hypothetical protein
MFHFPVTSHREMTVPEQCHLTSIADGTDMIYDFLIPRIFRLDKVVMCV